MKVSNRSHSIESPNLSDSSSVTKEVDFGDDGDIIAKQQKPEDTNWKCIFSYFAILNFEMMQE